MKIRSVGKMFFVKYLLMIDHTCQKTRAGTVINVDYAHAAGTGIKHGEQRR